MILGKLRGFLPIQKDFTQIDIYICSALNIAHDNKNLYDQVKGNVSIYEYGC